MRDINLGDTIYPKFTTRAFATGVPATLAGTPVLSVYEENNLTQITAGVSVTVDYDSVTGLNQATIVATSGNGYEAGKSYDLVITTGTVGGVSVVGEVVFSFTVEDTTALMPTTAGRSLDVAATGEAGIDLDNTNGTLAAAQIASNAFTAAKFAASSLDGKGDWNTSTPPTAAAIVDEWETQSQADPTGFHVNVLEVGGTAQTANDNGADINTLVNGVSLNAGAITNASLAGNMEIVFETDFATNYNTTRNAWATNVQDQVGTGNLPSDIIAISGDTGAADNLELMYDGTGYTDDTAPASRSQVGSLSLGSGGISTTASSFTATTAGTPTNSVTDTASENLVYHIVPPTGGALDIYYEFDVGGAGIPQSVEWVGYVQGNNDNCEVYFYNWAGAAFEQVGSISGSSGTTPGTSQFIATVAHVGTGANLGLVRFRFASDGGDVVTNVATDRILVTYTTNSQSIGYEGGAVWLDTNASNTGTESFVDGTTDNPVSTITAARTIMDNLNLRLLHILPSSSVTLSQGWDGYEIMGIKYTLNLGSQALPNTYIRGASIAASTATGASIIFEDCIFDNAVTLPPCVIRQSFFGDMTITAGSAGNFYFNDCRSRVAGTAAPNFDFGAAIGNTGLSVRGYYGGLEIENMGQSGTDTASIDGTGRLTYNANCTGGTLARSGSWRVTDNASAAITETVDDNTSNIAATLVDTNELQTDWANGGRLDLIIDAIQTEVLKLTTTAHAEPTGVPAANEAPIDKLGYLFMALRNQVDVTATKKTFYDDGGAAEWEKDLSDDGTTYTETEANAI